MSLKSVCALVKTCNLTSHSLYFEIGLSNQIFYPSIPLLSVNNGMMASKPDQKRYSFASLLIFQLQTLRYGMGRSFHLHCYLVNIQSQSMCPICLYLFPHQDFPNYSGFFSHVHIQLLLCLTHGLIFAFLSFLLPTKRSFRVNELHVGLFQYHCYILSRFQFVYLEEGGFVSSFPFSFLSSQRTMKLFWVYKISHDVNILLL
mmetsp:Transcript_46154/g.55565  ORF Transcript_46154/g.55565 Transcript_46154/m.55565 type:complete len:202 (+) Transcript_46154:254-859(+)